MDEAADATDVGHGGPSRAAESSDRVTLPYVVRVGLGSGCVVRFITGLRHPARACGVSWCTQAGAKHSTLRAQPRVAEAPSPLGGGTRQLDRHVRDRSYLADHRRRRYSERMGVTDDSVTDQRCHRDRGQASTVLQRLEPFDDIEIDRCHSAIRVDEAAGEHGHDRCDRTFGDPRHLDWRCVQQGRRETDIELAPAQVGVGPVEQGERLVGGHQHVEGMNVSVANDGRSKRRPPTLEPRHEFGEPGERNTGRCADLVEAGFDSDRRDVDAGRLERFDDGLRVEVVQLHRSDAELTSDSAQDLRQTEQRTANVEALQESNTIGSFHHHE